MFISGFWQLTIDQKYQHTAKYRVSGDVNEAKGFESSTSLQGKRLTSLQWRIQMGMKGMYSPPAYSNFLPVKNNAARH